MLGQRTSLTHSNYKGNMAWTKLFLPIIIQCGGLVAIGLLPSGLVSGRFGVVSYNGKRFRLFLLHRLGVH